MEAPRDRLRAQLILAEVCEESGDIDGAIGNYAAVAEADGNNVAALNNLAVLLARSDPNRALVYAERAAELAPGNAAIEDTVGWILYRQGSLDRALDHLKRAATGNAPAIRTFHLGMAYLKSGNAKLGEKYISQALRANPKLASEGI